MLQHLFWIAVGSFLAFLYSHWSEGRELSPSHKKLLACVGLVFLALAVLIVMTWAWLSAIRESQLRPHLVTTSINGHILTSQMVTNPAYVEWWTKPVITTNGIEYRQFAKTNYYWHVWKMFQP